jgi:hypothetical protein
MKKLSFLALVAFILAVGAGRTLAYDHDDKGWIDDQHHHHNFIHHGGHRGYWDHDKSGAKIFINV